jgi:hypothetical protein
MKNIPLQPVTIGTYLFLEKIGSPLVKVENRKPSTVELFTIIFVLTRPLPEAMELWAQGKEIFEAAVIGFASRYDLPDAEALLLHVLEHVTTAPAAQTTSLQIPPSAAASSPPTPATAPAPARAATPASPNTN